MKFYDQALIDELLKPGHVIKVFGQDVEIKDIPDDKRSGVLDPREFDIALKTLKDRQNTPFTLEAIRNQTGFPNTNINVKEIIIDVNFLDVNGFKLRVWSYRLRRSNNNKRPAIIYIHGGSWFAGSPFVSENTCRYMAETMDAVVFNVEISNAPERPFPCSLNDAKATVNFVYENAEKLGIDNSKITITGDSSGANIAAVTCLSEVGDKIASQVLYYPCVTTFLEGCPFTWDIKDFEMDPNYAPYISPRLNLGRSDGQGMDEAMFMIMRMYLQHGEDRKNPLISPLYGDYKIFPKTIIFSAEYDGLRIQDEYFSAKLKEAGVPCLTIRFRGIYHAFVDKIGILPQAEASILMMKNQLDKWGLL